MNTPLVSILIPCHNAERWIEETLDSALNQTWSCTEIIVVDDGSSDRSREILKRDHYEKIKVIEQENRGAGAARNRALDEAQGEFIQFLDADDLIAPDKIETQLQRLADAPRGQVASGPWGRFFTSVDETTFVPEPVWTDLPPVDWVVSSWRQGGMMACHAWLTPRAVIERAGRWEETPSPIDDGEFFTRVVLNSTGVAFCPEARSYYRSGIPGSWSRRRTPETIAAIFHSLELRAQNLLRCENSLRTRKACAVQFQEFIYDVYPQMPDLVRLAEAKVASLGGANIALAGGGRFFRFLSRTIGWKAARQVQSRYHKLRHRESLATSET